MEKQEGQDKIWTIGGKLREERRGTKVGEKEDCTSWKCKAKDQGVVVYQGLVI